MDRGARRLPVLVWLLGSAVASGCGGPPAAQLTGQVTSGGAPVTGAVVVLEHVSDGVTLTATLDADGRFIAAMHDRNGVPPGEYRIAVRPGEFAPVDSPLITPDAQGRDEASVDIPRRWRDPATSGRSVTLAEGENPPLDIDLSSPT